LFARCESVLAEQIAERLQREVRRLSCTHEGADFTVTLSQGLASLRPEDASLDTLYARADAAMYRANRQGKNQIVFD
jgi:diguanylate cyclase (GGDEF)-like protein